MDLRGQLETKRFRAPLKLALEAELQKLERMAVRIWQLLTALGVLAGVVFAATLSVPFGVACGVTSIVFLAWFLLVGAYQRRAPLGPRMRLVTIVVESSVPWMFLIALMIANGAAYALASWVPPMTFLALLVGQTVRLRPRAALLVGVLGGLTFPLAYLLFVRDRLEPELEGYVIYQLPMQITRGVSLLVSGLIGMVLARSLTEAIGRADTVARQQDLFGKYRLLETIARGGMGEVLEAVYCPDGGFERRVAIKRIHPQLAEQPRFVDAFRAEAELGARLMHPNIVQVLDFGRVGETYFLAMEYVDGVALSTLLQRLAKARRTVSPQVAGTIAREILAALTHAHEFARGPDGRPLRVVHRDLCPQNVLLSINGEVKLTDFGVARALQDAAQSQTLTTVGHAGYMAPEQALGEPVDPRSDLFPVGVILWELLTTRRLFGRPSQGATVLALLNDPVPRVTDLRPELDPAWDELIATALSRDPAARFESARAMSARLDAIADAHELRGSRELAELLAWAVAEPSSGALGDDAQTIEEPVAAFSSG